MEDPTGTIQVRITIDNQECELGSTKVSCKKSRWSAKSQQVLGASLHARNANIKLSQVSVALSRLFDLLQTSHDVVLTQTVKEYFHGRRKFTYEFKEVMRLYMEHREWQARKRMITKSTLSVCYNYNRHIIDFAAAAGVRTITQVDQLFFVSLYNYILEDDRGGEKFARKLTGFAKQALKWGRQKGYVPRLSAFDEQMPGVGDSEKGIDTTHLTVHQVQKLINYDFYLDAEKGLIAQQTAEMLTRERDAFVFNCFTGMHHCDYSRKEFRIEPYKGALFLRGSRQKTGITFSIKLLEPAVEILRKYNNSLSELPIKSNQKRNSSLKLIAIYVGIPLKLTTKIARKTFCDIALNEMLMSADDVAACLGLTSTKYLSNYGRIREARLLHTMKDWHELRAAS